MPKSTPLINLVVIRASDIDHAASFYQLLGLSMERHQHGSGPWHYCAESNGLVFEIYPGESDEEVSATRLGFQVDDLDGTLQHLQENGVKILREKATSPWGLRAVVEDFARHGVDLIEKQTRRRESCKENNSSFAAHPEGATKV
jgi:lactoylglutathione lyase